MWKDQRMWFFPQASGSQGMVPPDRQRERPWAPSRYKINIFSRGHEIRSRIYISLNFFLPCLFVSFSEKVSR